MMDTMTWEIRRIKSCQLNQKTQVFDITLQVIKLNREIFPPEAEMRYESLLDKAKQGTASSGLTSARRLVITLELLPGSHSLGGTSVLAYSNIL